MRDKFILGFETSCDETAVAIVRNGKDILANIISSQISIHQKYGGVVPEIASRKHMESITIILNEALEVAKLDLKNIDGIAVANGPGLKGSLLVGLSFAKAIAFALNIPLIGVDHIEGHICANFLNHNHTLTPPFISLIVSGGHTSLFLVKEIGKYKTIGQTRDDAAGEVFDKIAKYLNLGYPGGPIIEKMAQSGRKDYYKFPRPLINSGDFDFSFSGLKTAVIYFTKEQMKNGKKINKEDICASFQQAVVDTLIEKTIMAVKTFNIKDIVIGGGVSANECLRSHLQKRGEKEQIKIYFPPKELCTDNASMIAAAGYYKFIQGAHDGYDLDVYTT